MSKTLFVHYRDGRFWAFDVVSAVFLKHLIDAATSHLEQHDVEQHDVARTAPCHVMVLRHRRF